MVASTPVDNARRHPPRSRTLNSADMQELVHNRVMRTPEKVLSFASLPVAGALAGYVYLVRVLRPVPPATACPLGQVNDWRCASYQVIVSTPFFLLAGALIGTWFAYALFRLYTAPGPSFTWHEGLVTAPPLLAITAWIIALRPGVSWFWADSLGWWEVLLFFLAAVLVRLAIGIASVAKVRGSLILAFGVPIIFASLGYAFIRIFQLPPVGHPCPSFASASDCTYHPLIGESGPWVFLGLLAGIWLAYAVAVGVAGSARRTLYWIECAIAVPTMIAVIWWALAVGPDQAGEGYIDRFILTVCLTALLRLLLSARTVKKGISGMLAKLGMARETTTN